MERIVRGRDHDAGDEVAATGEIGDARRGDEASEAHLDATGSETAGDVLGQPEARFAGIHTDDDLGTLAMAGGPDAERAAEGEGRLAVERILSGHTTNAISTKQLSTHERDTPFF